MIYFIFIAVMVALVVIIAIQQNALEKAHQKHWDEVRDHAETRKKLAALERVEEKQEEAPLVADKAIRQRYPRKPTPMDYYTLFEANPIGDILDDLVNLFGGVSYTRVVMTLTVRPALRRVKVCSRSHHHPSKQSNNESTKSI